MQTVPVFLINLDRRPDRLAQMQAEFGKVGVEFERVPAVDAKNPSQDLDGWTFDPRISTGPATLCNMLSHLSVLSRVVADGIPLAMVVEDDVELSPDVRDLVSRNDWLPNGTGLVQCEGSAGSRNGIRLLGSAHSSSPASGLFRNRRRGGNSGLRHQGLPSHGPSSVQLGGFAFVRQTGRLGAVSSHRHTVLRRFRHGPA